VCGVCLCTGSCGIYHCEEEGQPILAFYSLAFGFFGWRVFFFYISIGILKIGEISFAVSFIVFQLIQLNEARKSLPVLSRRLNVQLGFRYLWALLTTFAVVDIH
jgi:hypothetical protein